MNDKRMMDKEEEEKQKPKHTKDDNDKAVDQGLIGP